MALWLPERSVALERPVPLLFLLLEAGIVVAVIESRTLTVVMASLPFENTCRSTWRRFNLSMNATKRRSQTPYLRLCWHSHFGRWFTCNYLLRQSPHEWSPMKSSYLTQQLCPVSIASKSTLQGSTSQNSSFHSGKTSLCSPSRDKHSFAKTLTEVK